MVRFGETSVLVYSAVRLYETKNNEPPMLSIHNYIKLIHSNPFFCSSSNFIGVLCNDKSQFKYPSIKLYQRLLLHQYGKSPSGLILAKLRSSQMPLTRSLSNFPRCSQSGLRNTAYSFPPKYFCVYGNIVRNTRVI